MIGFRFSMAFLVFAAYILILCNSKAGTRIGGYFQMRFPQPAEISYLRVRQYDDKIQVFLYDLFF